MTRKATPSDFDFIFQLYMHPSVNPFLLYEQMDAASFRPIFDDLVHKNILFIYEQAGTKTGMFKLIPLTHRNHHIVYLGGLAIDPAVGRKGEGRRMLTEILDYARHRGWLRIELSVATSNEKAIALYEKSGFQKEGTLRKYTHLQSENRFIDEVLMSYLF